MRIISPHSAPAPSNPTPRRPTPRRVSKSKGTPARVATAATTQTSSLTPARPPLQTIETPFSNQRATSVPQTPLHSRRSTAPTPLVTQKQSKSSKSTPEHLKRTARTVTFKRDVISFRDTPEGREMSWAALARRFGVKEAKSVKRWCVNFREQLLAAADPKARRQADSFLGPELESFAASSASTAPACFRTFCLSRTALVAKA